MSGEITLELPHGSNNPRNSEGAFVTLRDGRILFAYSRYFGRSGADHGSARIAARHSDDGGQRPDLAGVQKLAIPARAQHIRK